MQNPSRYFNSSPEIIRLTVMMCIRYPLSLRQVEDLLFERGIDLCHKTVRLWWNRFGPMFTAEIRKRRVQRHSYSNWRWHLGKVFVTDRLGSYPAAMTVIGNAANQEFGRWLNNRAENSRQPFRRREKAMAKFRATKTLEKYSSVHTSLHNHFNRHRTRRDAFKKARAAALAEWRQLAA
jgi:putative transposase